MRRPAPNSTRGDNLVLAQGTYQGTPGVFLRLTEDVHWAEIKEQNGTVRNHPVMWLQHSGPAALEALSGKKPS